MPVFIPSRPSMELRLRGTETVLLVEDDEGVRALARLVLQTRGYTVLEARHGDEAVRIAGQFDRPIHLVVSDLVMPGLSARSLLSKLQEERSALKFLFMSGYLDDAIAHHGLIEMGLPFLQKPFTPDSLTAKVREVLDGP
jgi:DNA-binding response OmpR family regulator